MIAVLGAGVMGELFVAGFIRGGTDPHRIVIAEAREDRAREVSERHGVRVLPAAEAVADAATVLLLVKPQDMAALLADIAPRTPSDSLVISLAAGVRLDTLEAAFRPGTPCIRAMPNTPALVGEGASAFALGEGCGPSAESFAATVLGSVGLAVRVDEALLDAVTGLTGSGPAYLFYVAEALIAAGVAEGLAPDTAEALVRQLFLGAGTLLSQSPDSPTRLRENVTSPNGTTAAGLAALGAAGGREAFLAAVRAATARSVELGRGS